MFNSDFLFKLRVYCSKVFTILFGTELRLPMCQMYVGVCARACVCVDVCVHGCMRVGVCVCVHARAHVHGCPGMWVCVGVRVCSRV